MPGGIRGEVRTDTFRASGAGGQHRNKTDSGVRLTHLDTGTVVTATEDRSQHRNRAVAWERLRAALDAQERAQGHQEANAARRGSLGAHRTFVWTAWRDEVTSPSSRKSSMRMALRGRLDTLIAG